MSDRVAWIRGRALPRLALAGLGLAFLAGCSSDVTRFSSSPSPFSGNRFSNPFASKTADAAPTPGVTTSPLTQAAPAAAAAQTASAGPKPQPVGGSAVGWTATGGSPIVVADGETLDTVSARYGVPSAASSPPTAFRAVRRSRAGCASSCPSITPTATPSPTPRRGRRRKSGRRTSLTLSQPRPRRSRPRTRKKTTPSPRPTSRAKKRISPRRRTAPGAAVAMPSRRSRQRSRNRRSTRSRPAISKPTPEQRRPR